MSEEQDKGATKGGDSTAELRAFLADLKTAGVNADKELLKENFKLREKLRLARSRPAVGEGEVVLKGDDLKAWNAYRELGELKELRKRLDAGDQAATKLGEIRRADTYREAARLAKFRPSAFATYATAAGLELVFEPGKEKDQDGNAILVPFVKGEGDSKTPLAEYAKKHWPDDLDLLKEGEPIRPGTPPYGRRAAMPPPTGDEPKLIDHLRATGQYGSVG